MSKGQQIRQLTEQFRAFGANAPEDWTLSQVAENIHEDVRFVFLWQTRQSVLGDPDTSRIDAHAKEAERRPRDPGAGIWPALKRLFVAGASREETAEVVRVMQWQTLTGIVYQLDDPRVVNGFALSIL